MTAIGHGATTLSRWAYQRASRDALVRRAIPVLVSIEDLVAEDYSDLAEGEAAFLAEQHPMLGERGFIDLDDEGAVEDFKAAADDRAVAIFGHITTALCQQEIESRVQFEIVRSLATQPWERVMGAPACRELLGLPVGGSVTVEEMREQLGRLYKRLPLGYAPRGDAARSFWENLRRVAPTLGQSDYSHLLRDLRHHNLRVSLLLDLSATPMGRQYLGDPAGPDGGEYLTRAYIDVMKNMFAAIKDIEPRARSPWSDDMEPLDKTYVLSAPAWPVFQAAFTAQADQRILLSPYRSLDLFAILAYHYPPEEDTHTGRRTELLAAVLDSDYIRLTSQTAISTELVLLKEALRAGLASRESIPYQQRVRDRPAREGRRQAEPSLPTRLIRDIAAGNAVLFAGSGVGAAAGHPTWARLLEGTVGLLEGSGLEGAWRALREQIDAGESQLVAEVLRSTVEPSQLVRALAAAYTPPTGLRAAVLLEVLSDVPFAGVVTNTYSDILIRAFGGREPVVLSLADAEVAPTVLADERFFVLKAYGDIGGGGEFFLSAEDFRRGVEDRRDLGLFLRTLFGTRTLVFVGTSLEGVEQFCIGSGWFEPSDRAHYAFVPDRPGLELQTTRMADRYGVHLLPIDSADVAASALRAMRRLNVHSHASMAFAKAVERAPMRLEHVVLENIGPFRFLELDLDRDVWSTVLLGNNGSGKTTVLRAIALALCGESPQTTIAPGDLLRSGATAGSIVIELNGTQYRTKLLRESGRVRVEAPVPTPVQAGVWLAVGFPALRGVSSRARVELPWSRPGVPAPDDVLPLVTCDADHRLDDVKAWIATNWLASKDRSRVDAHRRERLVLAFFDVLRKLTPGIDFQLHDVDPDTDEVLLSTADGVIRLEQLSRGMSSIVACVGVLLKRLYEVYGDDPDARERSALLLIDELDAHLHPAWQRAVLPLLHDVFPNLQLVGTTHSPLIIGNLHGGQVFHIHREGAEPVAVPLGWRTDQVLTGPGFGLESTLDETTVDQLASYRRLLAKRARTDGEDAELEQLAARLRRRLPEPESTPTGRDGAALLEEWLDNRLREIPDDERQRLAEEARAGLAALRTPGRDDR